MCCYYSFWPDVLSPAVGRFDICNKTCAGFRQPRLLLGFARIIDSGGMWGTGAAAILCCTSSKDGTLPAAEVLVA